MGKRKRSAAARGEAGRRHWQAYWDKKKEPGSVATAAESGEAAAAPPISPATSVARKATMEPPCDAVKMEEEPTGGQASSSSQQPSVDSIGDHLEGDEDALSQRDEADIKKETKLIADFDPVTGCGIFIPTSKSKPYTTSNHSEDALALCDEIAIKEEEEEVCIKNEPIEDWDPTTGCTTFVQESKPGTTEEKKDHSQYIRKTHQTGGGPPPPPPKPTDEVTFLVQGILNNDLPRPSDILDSECVQSFQEEDLHPNVSSIENESKLRSWMINMRTRYSKISDMKSVKSGDGATDDSLMFSERDQWIMAAFAFLKPHIVRCPTRKSKVLPASYQSQQDTQVEPVAPDNPPPETLDSGSSQRGEPQSGGSTATSQRVVTPQQPESHRTVSTSSEDVAVPRTQLTDKFLKEILENQQKVIGGHEALVQMLNPKSVRARRVRTFQAFLAPIVEAFDDADYNEWLDHVFKLTRYYDEPKESRAPHPPCIARFMTASTHSAAPPAVSAPPSPPQQPGSQQPWMQAQHQQFHKFLQYQQQMGMLPPPWQTPAPTHGSQQVAPGTPGRSTPAAGSLLNLSGLGSLGGMSPYQQFVSTQSQDDVPRTPSSSLQTPREQRPPYTSTEADHEIC